MPEAGRSRHSPTPGPSCPFLDTCSPTPTGDGWLLKAVSLGPWVHLIEELQLFDQEPVESLVLSRSKVTIRPHPPCPRMAPRGGEMPERGARTLVESALCGRPIFHTARS